MNTLNEYKSALMIFYDEIKVNFNDFMAKKPEEVDKIRVILDNIHNIDDEKVLFSAFDILDYYLFKNNITKLATKEVINTKSPRAVDNNAHC
jgi:hypothetical protein